MGNREQWLGTFTRAYIEAALWSTSDESDERGGEPLDKNYGPDDIAPETMALIEEDCANFAKRWGRLIEADDSPEIQKWGRWSLAGHDFWLTREGHGAGFWDGGWPKHGDELTKAAKAYGSFDLYVGDDGLIYGPPPDWYQGRHARKLPSGVSEAVPRPHRVRGPYRKPPRLPPHGHLVLPRAGVVRDFSSRQEIVEHARQEGATHVVAFGSGVTLYFPRGGKYEEARVWKEHGYWHAPGPGARVVVDRLPQGAEPIESHLGRAGGRRAAESPRRGGHAVRDYEAVDGHGRRIAGPFRDYGEAKREADRSGGYVQFSTGRPPPMAGEASVGRRRGGGRRAAKMTTDSVMKLAGDVALEVGGNRPTLLEGGFRWSEPNVSARFTTYSPEHDQKVVCVVSIFEDGSTALNVFSDEGLSGTATYENITHFTYASADVRSMVEDINWVRQTVDGYAASWQSDGGDLDEARPPRARRRSTRPTARRRRSTRR